MKRKLVKISKKTINKINIFREELTGRTIIEKQEQLRKERILEPNGSGRCLYNTLVGAAEEAAGKNLTRKQKNELFDELSKDVSPAVDPSDATVNKKQTVLDKALDKLGENDRIKAKYYHYDKPGDIQGKLLFTIREFDKSHFNLGDSDGNFLWESLEYNNEEHIKKCKASKLRYITFEER